LSYYKREAKKLQISFKLLISDDCDAQSAKLMSIMSWEKVKKHMKVMVDNSTKIMQFSQIPFCLSVEWELPIVIHINWEIHKKNDFFYTDRHHDNDYKLWKAVSILKSQTKMRIPNLVEPMYKRN
jgi:hypothetical protein